MHHALVADLVTREEFDERVEKKYEELKGAVDELCAAMLVVEELGRSHIKIGAVKSAHAPLVSFFGKVLEKSEPREFKRGEEGEEAEPGLVASMILGDPTGTVKVTVWDSLAAGTFEIEVNSVLEVIGKPKSGRSEVTGLAMRESLVTIVETKLPPKTEEMKTPLIAKVLAIGSIREIGRRDGSVSYLQEIIIGDESGTARIISWDPEVFSGVEERFTYSFSGLTRKEDEEMIEYIARSETVITPHIEDILVRTQDASEVSEGQTSVVTGTAVLVSQVRRFVTRRGDESQVKNVKIEGSAGKKFIYAALWNEAAETVVFPGDSVEIINAKAKLNKFGEIELSVGRSSYLRAGVVSEEFIEVSGVVVPRPDGLTVDNGDSAWLVFSGERIFPGERIMVSGFVRGGRITAEKIERLQNQVAGLREML